MVDIFRSSSDELIILQKDYEDMASPQEPNPLRQASFRRILSYLEDDYKVLPNTPTIGMVKAACEGANIDEELALRIYHLMIEAYE